MHLRTRAATKTQNYLYYIIQCQCKINLKHEKHEKLPLLKQYSYICIMHLYLAVIQLYVFHFFQRKKVV